jgi:cullin 3
VYCADQRRPSIYTTALILFRVHVLDSALMPQESNNSIRLVLEHTILDMIRMERNGEVIDRNLIRACCHMLEGLYDSTTEDETRKLYLLEFEPKFLLASQEFYRKEGQELLANADASTFCSHARRRLKEEEERCQQTISVLTEPKIKAVVDKELIGAHIRDVINMPGTGVKHMLDNDRIEDLANVYDLIARVDHRKGALKDAVQKRIVELGREINTAGSVNAAATKPDGEKADKADKGLNQQTAAAIAWVEEILQLKSKCDKLWAEAFRKNVVMEKALELSFQDFINENQRSAEHLSLFLDQHLKQGAKGKTEAEVDVLLDKGIVLLQYLADKDAFEKYYKKHMSKRLLMKKTVSRDMERLMLSKMKTRIGNSFTQKLEGLLKDMNISDDLNAQYKNYVSKLDDGSTKRIEMDASILTTTVWPFDHLSRTTEDDGTPRLQCVYPAELEGLKQSFEKFYLNKHSGRALKWLPSMGTADIRATFKGSNGKVKRHELNVSTFGTIILMLFKETASDFTMTFEEIHAATNIPKNELIRNLQSLSVAPKTRILKKEPMSREIKNEDQFSFNEDFTSPYLKVKVSVIAANRVENIDERKETQKRIDDERGLAIDSALVRVMKQRRQLAHVKLVNEALILLIPRFKPDTGMIKKRIESLIDREYLERGSDPQTPSYTYLA